MICPIRLMHRKFLDNACVTNVCAWWIEDEGCSIKSIAHDASWVSANMAELLNEIHKMNKEEKEKPFDYQQFGDKIEAGFDFYIKAYKLLGEYATDGLKMLEEVGIKGK